MRVGFSAEAKRAVIRKVHSVGARFSASPADDEADYGFAQIKGRIAARGGERYAVERKVQGVKIAAKLEEERA